MVGRITAAGAVLGRRIAGVRNRHLPAEDVPAARELLAKERDERGWSNGEMADFLGLSRSYVEKLVSPANTDRICRTTFANIAFGLHSAPMLDLMVRRYGFRVLQEERAERAERCEAALTEANAALEAIMRLSIGAGLLAADGGVLRTLTRAAKRSLIEAPKHKGAKPRGVEA